ncbi:ribosome maturation protein [Pilobolus umbonatus]|nr:ribosome maturation protein [Pilobolus umbonatus]
MPSDKTVKIVYKGNDTDFYIVADRDMVSKWKKDKSIPLVEVVESFNVFSTPTGSISGEPVRPAKGILETTFNTSNEDTIVKTILEKGEQHAY